MDLVLQRKPSDTRATLGQLFADGAFLCYTLEPSEYLDAYPAIPAGKYRVVINYSNRFKRRLPLILDVPGRLGIRVHPGNVPDDTEGCILLGTSSLADELGNSRIACDMLQSRIARPLARGEDVWLTVREAPKSKGLNA